MTNRIQIFAKGNTIEIYMQLTTWLKVLALFDGPFS